MKTLFHPVTLTLLALGTIVAACAMAGSANCSSAGDGDSVALFLTSTGAAAASGLSAALHPRFGDVLSTESWLMGFILLVVFGGAWFVIGGFIFMIVTFSHCPLGF